jgi:hypothetical protein
MRMYGGAKSLACTGFMPVRWGVFTFRSISAVSLLLLVAGDAHARTRPIDDPSWVAAPVPPLQSGRVVVLAHEPARGVPSLLWAASSGPASTPGAGPGLSAPAAARHHLGRHAQTYRVGAAALAGLRLRFVHDTRARRHHRRAAPARRRRRRLSRRRQGAARPRSAACSPSPAPRTRPLMRRQRPTLHARPRRGRRAPCCATSTSLNAARRAWLAGCDARRLVTASSAPRACSLRQPARASRSTSRSATPWSPATSSSCSPRPAAPSRSCSTSSPPTTAACSCAAASPPATASSTACGPTPTATTAPPTARWSTGPPHPTGEPDQGPVAFAAPNAHHDGGLQHQPGRLADPWLPAGATETRGNNVDAYVDHKNPNGLQLDDGDFRASVTAPGVFDRHLRRPRAARERRSVDGRDHPAVLRQQLDARLVVRLGLRRGHRQRAGDNFGRGGAEGDPLRAEAQDAALVGNRNNANMSTPADGASPVMQMYLWTPHHGQPEARPAGQELRGQHRRASARRTTT